jgi:colicin import membrane protein
MNRLPAFLLLALLCPLSFAQVASSGNAVSNVSAERARIQSDRDVGESRFSQQEAECYARFAVTDCLHEVRLLRRHLLDDLRRQTVVLNDTERRKKTLLKMDRTELKSSSQKIDQ